MSEEMRTFGYLCPQCGKTVMGTRSVFALEASNAEVECACGKSALKVEFDGTEYHIYVPCGICGETHEAHCPPERVLHGATALGCAKTKQFCCFIGPEGTVEKNLRDLAVLAEKEHQQQEDGEEAFVDNVIMYEILSELKDIAARGRLPILVGGTGLYIESFLNGVRFAEQKADPALREKLEQEAAALGPEAMHQKLAAVDPDYAATVHPNNVGRVVRALELYYATGKTMSRQRAESLPETPPFDSLVFCLAPADRAQLYRRIDLRVDRMLEAGILEEAKLVFENRGCYRTAAQAIGYKEFFPYFEGTAELAACADKLKQASRNYAKRQLTWFRRMENIIWLDPGDEAILQQAETTVREHFGL